MNRMCICDECQQEYEYDSLIEVSELYSAPYGDRSPGVILTDLVTPCCCAGFSDYVSEERDDFLDGDHNGLMDGYDD